VGLSVVVVVCGDVMIELVNFIHAKLEIKSWQVVAGDSYTVLGRNGSGKQFIDQLLLGKIHAFKADKYVLPKTDEIRVVSFEALQAVYENELKIDETDITDEIDFGTKVREFLPEASLDHPLLSLCNLTHRLDTGYRLLSSGESKKLLIVKAILEGCKFLILDNPFDDLDQFSRKELSLFLSTLSQQKVSVIFLISNTQDIPLWETNLALINDNQFIDLKSLNKNDAMDNISEVFSLETFNDELLSSTLVKEKEDSDGLLVDVKRASVIYGGKPIFENINLKVSQFQHTLITGPNGCGKSTLLHLVTGDCPQTFSNDVSVIGYRRGNGESIWDVKKHLGIVSPDLHRNYRVNCSVLTVVASGFFDSIGLYSPINYTHKQICLDWLTLFNIDDKADVMFQQLSYGEQRLVLIARAMVKKPLLLILDEPTQGLDEINRNLVLTLLKKVAYLQVSTILMVSHRLDEHSEIFKQKINFD
jgi:molybdate transport system ATP-binding protein